MFRVLLLIMIAGLVSCGGGGASSSPTAPSKDYSIRMVVQNGVQQVSGFNASANFPVVAEGLTPFESAAKQVKSPGSLILIMAPFRDTAFADLDRWIAAANTYPAFKWVYLYDELFWSPGGNGKISIGAFEDEVTAAAKRVQQAGLKTVVSIDTGVILAPGFTVKNWSAFDVILVVDYPSAYINQDSGGCSLDKNVTTNLLACSINRLRALGFKGEIGYVYQGFGDTSSPDLTAALTGQKETIAAGAGLGVSWLVGFGLFPYEGLVSPLYPGLGTDIAPLVLP